MRRGPGVIEGELEYSIDGIGGVRELAGRREARGKEVQARTNEQEVQAEFRRFAEHARAEW